MKNNDHVCNQKFYMTLKILVFIIIVYTSVANAMSDECIDTIAAHHGLNINHLKEYYCRLQLISHYIFDILHQSGISKIRNKLSERIIPERNQIEPNGGVALEVYNDVPRGFWTPLGFLPLCEGNFDDNKEQLVSAMKQITTMLMLTKLRGSRCNTWGSGNYICKVGKDLAENAFSDVYEVPIEKIVPSRDVHLLWQAVKPKKRL